MVQAKRDTKKVEKVVTEEVDVITLELTQDEANILRTILGKFERHGTTTPIFKALEPLTVRGKFKVVSKQPWETVPTLTVTEGNGYDW